MPDTRNVDAAGQQEEAPPASGDTAYSAQLAGSGAIAQGAGAIALAAGAVYVGKLNIESARPRPSPPFQAPAVARAVPRTYELTRLKACLLDEQRELAANTVGVHGFGGVGKTTLARLACADPEVVCACRDGILWVALGKNPADPRAQISDLVSALTGDCRGCLTLAGARAQLQAALAGRRVLLVLDDVWDEAQIRDLIEASSACARLITTRNTETLPFDAQIVDLAAMEQAEARQLLGAGLRVGDQMLARLDALVRQLGAWPVLLGLANRTLCQRVLRQKTPLAKALDTVASDLARKGVCAFDPARDVAERDQAVAATLDASLELLAPHERRRYAELAIFPQDVPIPLARAAELWQFSAGVAAAEAYDLVAVRLEPLSLIDYDGDTCLLRVHEVLRSYLAANLPNQAALHRCLGERWGERPPVSDAYAWRWLAFHRAQAALLSEQPQRHEETAALVALVSDAAWQELHEKALHDLPALREALHSTLAAALGDDSPEGVALLVRAADSLLLLAREQLRPEPIYALARNGQLDAARRRSALFAIDEHWRQALLLALAWLAPAAQRDEARSLCREVSAELQPASAGPAPAGPGAVLADLVRWVRAALWDEPAPEFPLPEQETDAALIEALLKRVGGGEYDRELIIRSGLDPDLHDPDRPPPTRGVFRQRSAAPDGSAAPAEQARYLAELDGPCLIAYAVAEPEKAMAAFSSYLSVYTHYNYPEYRFSSLWLLLGNLVRFPSVDGAAWVREGLLRLLSAALGGGSVEFEQGLSTAVIALRARAGDASALAALKDDAYRLIEQAARLKPGRDREGSDVWGHHKRAMLASAQALGWLLGETILAGQVLDEAAQLADSGFAGYQAPACLALAEALHVCRGADPRAAAAIELALEWAQRAAHNVQDPSFCARMTARVNAVRRNWWPLFDLDERARRLPEATHLPEFAAWHRVGHGYPGRRPDAMPLPPWAGEDRSFDGLQRLYQRPRSAFIRLNGVEKMLSAGDEVAVPDPGLLPHLAARIAAEVLAQAGSAQLPPQRLQLLRSLVPYALVSPTALDAVLTRLVLAQARRDSPIDPGEASALQAALALRLPAATPSESGELLAGAARLPS